MCYDVFSNFNTCYKIYSHATLWYTIYSQPMLHKLNNKLLLVIHNKVTYY